MAVAKGFDIPLVDLSCWVGTEALTYSYEAVESQDEDREMDDGIEILHGDGGEHLI